MEVDAENLSDDSITFGDVNVCQTLYAGVDTEIINNFAASLIID